MLRASSSEAMAAVCERYRDYGPRLMSEIQFWNDMATEIFAPHECDSDLGLIFGNSTNLHGYFDPEQGAVLVLPPVPKKSTSTTIAHTILHEKAHDVRFGLSRRNGWSAEPSLFGAIIDEGVAACSETACFDQPLHSAWTDKPLPQRYSQGYVDGLLLDVLFYSGLDQYDPADIKKIDKYILGNHRHPLRGYDIGHYIVSAAVDHDGLSFHEMLAMPDEYYREFAENSL